MESINEYGSTPVSPEDEHGFVEGFKTKMKAELDQVEIDALLEVFSDAAAGIAADEIGPEQLRDPAFLVELHRKALSGIWSWAGKIRDQRLVHWRRQGADRRRVAKFMDDLSAWLRNDWFSDHDIALRAHHRLTWIHPFLDVNGRLSRLYADLVLVYLTEKPTLVIDWRQGKTDKPAYVAALRHADIAAGDVAMLRKMLPTQVLTMGAWRLAFWAVGAPPAQLQHSPAPLLPVALTVCFCQARSLRTGTRIGDGHEELAVAGTRLGPCTWGQWAGGETHFKTHVLKTRRRPVESVVTPESSHSFAFH